MANPHAIPITLSEADRGRLQGWVRRRKTGQALADPPPLKWSALRYGFEPEEDRDGEQEAPA